MAGNARCPECGGELTDTASGRICPRCVLGFALTAATGLEEGRTIGRYTLVRRLGAGGMGEVWLAEQGEPVQRRVALKVIRAGLESEQIVARFENERQALARMDHPAIARVYDAGTTPGSRPYFVMEYVEGLPIVEYCDRHRLGARERLRLFLEVCDGVEHAHQKALIHRDLKSSNVLVADVDGQPRPKIIDFGVAKSTGGFAPAQSLYTQTGAMVGTPETMSPEQARGSADIDTRTDVYSLGVILYELLVGALPFDAAALREAGLAEMLRAIQEDPPPRPSVRLATLAERATTVAEQRGTDPGRLRRSLDGDLDWIAMKALEKERERRYASARELAEDVRAALEDRPVLAGPPSASYRVGKFVRRHRLAVGLAAAAVLALALGLAGTTWGLLRARAAEAEAVAAEETAREDALTANRSLEFMVDLFDVSDPGRNLGETLTAREVLDRGVERIDEELLDEPRVRARLMSKMGEIYRKLGLYEPAEELMRQARELRAERFGEDAAETLESGLQLALLLINVKRQVEAEPLLEEVLAGYARAGRSDDDPQVLLAQNLRATTLRSLGRYDEARPLFERAIAGLTATRGAEDPSVLDTRANYGVLLTLLGELEAARDELTDVAERVARVQGEKHPRHLGLLNMLGNVEADLGNHDRAEELYRESLRLNVEVHGEEHPSTLMLRRNLARLLWEKADYDAAIAEYRRSFQGLRETLGAGHLRTLDTQCFYADTLRDAGRLDEAIAVYRDAMRVTESEHGIGHRQFGFCAGGLVSLYMDRGRADEAGAACDALVRSSRAQATAEGATGEEWNNLAWSMLTCAPDAGPESPEAAEALEWARRGVEDLPTDPFRRGTLSMALERVGDIEAAIRELEAGLERIADVHPFHAELERELARLRDEEAAAETGSADEG